MHKTIFDTNIYIDFYNTGKFKEFIYQKRYPEIIYVSSVVIMELLAGAFTKNDKMLINNLIKTAKAGNKIVTPNQEDYSESGKILAKLQMKKGYNLKKTYALTNDVLIALSVRRIGATLVTQNRKDFEMRSEFKSLSLHFE